MKIEVVAMAALREGLNRGRLTLDLSPGATGTDLREELARLYPRWRDLIRACRLARGVDFIEDDTSLSDGEEVVLIPPVSGGSGPPAVHLSTEPLDGRVLQGAAGRSEAGAVVMFAGTARSPSDGKDVRHLVYEAYEPMARAMMERIVTEVRERWPVTAVFLHHRLGRVEIGEASVIAVASAPHRAEAFEACRHLIERLKADVPIWKKEFFADGSVWVGAPGECGG